MMQTIGVQSLQVILELLGILGGVGLSVIITVILTQSIAQVKSGLYTGLT